ncbi:MAG: hypothetical protein WA446_20975 [Steroidobacteraceae bacterium]
MLFFEFPEDAHWNDDRDAVEFSVILRPYEGTVRIGRRVFQGVRGGGIVGHGAAA